MNKVTKYALLFLLMLPFMLTESIYIMLLGTSVIFGWIAKPFKIMGEKIIDKANDINIK